MKASKTASPRFSMSRSHMKWKIKYNAARRRVGFARTAGTSKRKKKRQLVFSSRFIEVEGIDGRMDGWIEEVELTLDQSRPLPPRVAHALPLPALAPDDGVDVPVDDLRILVAEPALVARVAADLQLQAVAPPARGDVAGLVELDAALEQDGEEEGAGFALGCVVGWEGRRGDEAFVFVLEEDRAAGGSVVGAAAGHLGRVFHVGELVVGHVLLD